MKKYQTEQRKILVDFFKEIGHQALSARDIYSRLSDTGISLSAVYRNLAEMEKQGVVCKVSDNKGSSALYHYVDPDECVGTIHLKCEDCQATFHLNRNISQMVIGFAKEDLRFKVTESSAFLYGQCENCSQNLTK